MADTDHWLNNFTVHSSYEFQRITQKVGYQIIEQLYYDLEENRIRQYDTSIKYPDNTVYTVRLRYYDGSFSFTHGQVQIEPALTPVLVSGILIELVVIIFLVARRLRN